jgi:kynureninase
VAYGSGSSRWAGATYDPTSNYRAAAVFDFHEAHGLTADRLRSISRQQVKLLQREFEALDFDPSVAQVEPMPDERRAGFLAVRAPRAGELCEALRRAGVLCDFRGTVLRLGPAPYVRDDQLRDAIASMREIRDRLGSSSAR